MALPAVGDGFQVGDGNTGENLVVGNSTRPVLIAPAAGYVGFYGKTPVVRRAYTSAVHATAGIATSASFGATQLAAIQEIQNTLIGLGVWATA
jgi:hypothetical protein